MIKVVVPTNRYTTPEGRTIQRLHGEIRDIPRLSFDDHCALVRKLREDMGNIPIQQLNAQWKQYPDSILGDTIVIFEAGGSYPEILVVNTIDIAVASITG